MGSKMRRLAFPSESLMKPLGQFTSFFTTPYSPVELLHSGTMLQAEDVFYSDPGYARAYLSIMSPSLGECYELGIPAQRQMMCDLFADPGWEAELVLNLC
jgi:hypothetical protein